MVFKLFPLISNLSSTYKNSYMLISPTGGKQLEACVLVVLLEKKP